jgi:hypothetical protein
MATMIFIPQLLQAGDATPPAGASVASAAAWSPRAELTWYGRRMIDHERKSSAARLPWVFSSKMFGERERHDFQA